MVDPPPVVVFSCAVIELTPEPLPANQVEKLRDWLAKPELQILREVIDARVKVHQVSALKHAMNPEIPQQNLSAASFGDARRYQDCLDVLAEFAYPATDFNTVKLK